MKYERKLCALVLILALLAGCGAGKESPTIASQVQESAAPAETAVVEAPQTTASPVEQTGYGYTAEEQELEEGSFSQLVLVQETPWLVQQQENTLLLRNLEQGTELSVALEASVLGACGTDEGILLCLEENGAYSLRQVDHQGNLSESVVFQADNGYPAGLAVDGSGYRYVLSGQQVIVLSPAGKAVSSLALSDGSVGMRLSTLSGGQVVLTSAGNGSGTAVRLLNTESIGKALTDSQSSFRCFGGYTALLSGGGNLYTMDTETNQMDTLLNWVDSGIDPGTITDCLGVSQDKIWYISSSESGAVLGCLSRVAASELPQREIIRLGLGASVNSALASRITALAVAYNNAQESRCVHLVDYSLYEDGDQRLQEDAEDLDVLVGDSCLMDGVSLMDLEALYDQEVGTATILSGVQNATESDRLPVSFYIETLAGRSDLVGEQQGWTPQEFSDILAQHTDLAVLKMCNSYDTLNQLLRGYIGTVPGIAPLLEACSRIPVDDQELYQLEANNSTDDALKCVEDGTLLLAQAELTDFMDFRELSAQVGQQLVYKGYPSESGNGTTLKFTAFLGISQSSVQIEGAWELIKKVLADSGEFLGEQGLGFPILQDDFMELAQSATQKITYQDENGDTVEQDPTIWVNGVAQSVSPFTQEEIQELLSWLDVASGSYDPQGHGWLTAGADALKQVIENGTNPTDAAEAIE